MTEDIPSRQAQSDNSNVSDRTPVRDNWRVSNLDQKQWPIYLVSSGASVGEGTMGVLLGWLGWKVVVNREGWLRFALSPPVEVKGFVAQPLSSILMVT